jgi:outer membrane receptor for ferrienterochelin and colicins
MQRTQHFQNIPRTTLLVFCILVFPALASSKAAAQDQQRDITQIPLEELNKIEVYSASKFSQKASEAPASISIVTAADIQHYGYRTLGDILRNTTGFFVTYDRNYAYLGARGIGLTGDYNSRVLILIDGHRINDNVYGSSAIGTEFPLSLDLIDRIEIVRGPGSSLYGTNAFFAVINVITKPGRIFNGGYLSLEAGSRQIYQGTVAFGQQYSNGVELLVSGTYMDSKGYRQVYYPEFDNPENNNGIAEDADTDGSNSIFASVSYHGLSTQLVHRSREKRFPTAAFGTVFNDRRTITEDTWTYFDCKYQRTVRNQWDILARTFIDAYESDGSYVYDYSTESIPSLVINKDLVYGKWWGGEAQLTRRFSDHHHITAGTEWRYSFQADQLNYDEEPYYQYLDSKLKTTDMAVYLQGESAVRENLLLSAGLRYDHYSTFGGTVNPRFALVYSPRKSTTAKVLYGHAFRAPNLFEMYYQDNISSKGNPDLNPENIKTLEFVLEQYIRRKFRISGSAYRYNIQNQITQQIDPADELIVFENFGTVHAQGVEIELEGKNIFGIDGRISYALQNAENHERLEPLANSPRHIAQLNLFAPWLGARGGTGLEMRYMSSRKTLGNGSVGGFLIADLTVLYRTLLPNLELSAGIYNIFNRRFYDPGGAEHVQDALQQDSRSFRVRMGYAFPTR